MNLHKDLALALDTSLKLQECMEIKYLNSCQLQMVSSLADITIDALSYKNHGLDIFNDSRLLHSVFFGSFVSNKVFGTVVGLQLQSINPNSFNIFKECINLIFRIKCFSCNVCKDTIDLFNMSNSIFMQHNLVVCKNCRQYVKND